MTEDNSRGHAPPATTYSAADPPASAPQKRLEDLLLDDEPPKTTFRQEADQEVKKSGNNVDRSLRWPLVVFALLIVAVVAVVGGWYQYGDLLTGQPGVGDPVRVELRMAVPERPQSQEATQGAVPEAMAAGEAAVQEVEQTTAEVAAEVVTAGDVNVALEAPIAIAPETSTAVTPPSTVPRAGVEEEATETVLIASEGVAGAAQLPADQPPPAVAAEPVHRVLVGPFISQGALEQATALLLERGFQPEQHYGSGTVDMIRLLEGIYPRVQAQQRLEEVRKEFSSAFLLPDGERWALYIGSFSERDRARRQQRELVEHQIQVVPVDSQLTMEGPLLVVVRSDLKAAEEVAAEVNASGLRARIEIER